MTRRISEISKVLEEYQKFVTSNWRGFGDSYTYTAIALGGEAGEILNEIKKEIRSRKPYSHRHEVALEIGDTLYYLTRLADEYGYNLEEIMELNIDKLNKRKEMYGPNFSD